MIGIYIIIVLCILYFVYKYFVEEKSLDKKPLVEKPLDTKIPATQILGTKDPQNVEKILELYSDINYNGYNADTSIYTNNINNKYITFMVQKDGQEKWLLNSLKVKPGTILEFGAYGVGSFPRKSYYITQYNIPDLRQLFINYPVLAEVSGVYMFNWLHWNMDFKVRVIDQVNLEKSRTDEYNECYKTATMAYNYDDVKANERCKINDIVSETTTDDLQILGSQDISNVEKIVDLYSDLNYSGNNINSISKNDINHKYITFMIQKDGQEKWLFNSLKVKPGTILEFSSNTGGVILKVHFTTEYNIPDLRQLFIENPHLSGHQGLYMFNWLHWDAEFNMRVIN